jgi:hypothetical protein
MGSGTSSERLLSAARLLEVSSPTLPKISLYSKVLSLGGSWQLLYIKAFLRQVVTDALSTPKGTGDWTEDTGGWTEDRRREAQAFLLDPHRLAPWIELTGADVDKMQGVLLRAAGLTKPSQV